MCIGQIKTAMNHTIDKQLKGARIHNNELTTKLASEGKISKETAKIIRARFTVEAQRARNQAAMQGGSAVLDKGPWWLLSEDEMMEEDRRVAARRATEAAAEAAREVWADVFPAPEDVEDEVMEEGAEGEMAEEAEAEDEDEGYDDYDYDSDGRPRAPEPVSPKGRILTTLRGSREELTSFWVRSDTEKLPLRFDLSIPLSKIVIYDVSDLRCSCNLGIILTKLSIPSFNYLGRHTRAYDLLSFLPSFRQVLHELFHTQGRLVLLLLVVIRIGSLSVQVCADSWRYNFHDLHFGFFKLCSQIHRPEMHPSFCPIIYRVDHGSRDIAKHAANIHDNRPLFLVFEVRQKRNCKVHWPSDIDINLLVRFL